MTRNSRGYADLPPGPARDLVDLFRRLPHRRSRSLGQVAITTKLSPSHVSEVLRGWKIPSQEAAATIARAFGATAEEAGEAHRLAGQARELKKYQRAQGEPLPASHRSRPPASGPGQQEHPATLGAGAHPPGHVGTSQAADQATAVARPHVHAWLASAGTDGTVRIWDPVTGYQVGNPLVSHTGTVWALCALPGVDRLGKLDGRTWIASAGRDGTLRVWDPVTGGQVGGPLAAHAGPVWALCALPGVGQLASAGSDGTVFTWDAMAGRSVGGPLTGHTGGVAGICALPGVDGLGKLDGRTWLASAGRDGTVRVWNAATGRPAGRQMAGHTSSVTGVCALPGADGRAWLASAGRDGTVRVWDPVTGGQVGDPLAGHAGPVWGVCALPGADGQTWLASAGLDGTVRVWYPVTGGRVGDPLTGHTSAVTGVCAVPRVSRRPGQKDGPG